MSFVTDLSRATKTVTAAQLVELGTPADPFLGAIVYTGCDDDTKNCPPDRFEEYRSAFPVALVIENGERDLEGGAAAGAKLAHNVLAAASALGYNVRHCVLFTSADFNAGPPDYPLLLEGWDMYAAAVPVPGYYGDSDSMDFLMLHATRPPAVRIQSESDSFSPEHPSPYANLWQRFQDPRAGGLDVDVDQVVRGPLLFDTGADLLADERSALFDIQAKVGSLIGVAQGQTSTGGTIAATLSTAQMIVNKLNALTALEGATEASVSAQLSAIETALAKVQTGQLDPAAFVAALEAAGVPLEIATDLAAHLQLKAA